MSQNILAGGGNQEVKILEPMIIDPQGRINKVCIPSELCPTLRAQIHGNPPQVIEPSGTILTGRIRRLTPLETFRLMGFSDEDFDRAKWYSKEESELLKAKYPKRKFKLSKDNRVERISDSQLYKQAGNSIVVNVLEAILGQLFKKRG